MKPEIKQMLNDAKLAAVPYNDSINIKRVYCNDCGLEFYEQYEIYRCPECYSHSVRDITKKEN